MKKLGEAYIGESLLARINYDRMKKDKPRNRAMKNIRRTFNDFKGKTNKYNGTGSR